MQCLKPSPYLSAEITYDARDRLELREAPERIDVLAELKADLQIIERRREFMHPCQLTAALAPCAMDATTDLH